MRTHCVLPVQQQKHLAGVIIHHVGQVSAVGYYSIYHMIITSLRFTALIKL